MTLRCFAAKATLGFVKTSSTLENASRDCDFINSTLKLWDLLKQVILLLHKKNIWYILVWWCWFQKVVHPHKKVLQFTMFLENKDNSTDNNKIIIVGGSKNILKTLVTRDDLGSRGAGALTQFINNKALLLLFFSIKHFVKHLPGN